LSKLVPAKTKDSQDNWTLKSHQVFVTLDAHHIFILPKTFALSQDGLSRQRERLVGGSTIQYQTALTRYQMNARSLLVGAALMLFSATLFSDSAYATSNYTYKPDEYVVIVDGRSPDGRYTIASHGDGEDGYENFHLYLMDATTGKKIGPLEEIKDTLDTGADAFYAKWSADSSQVSITYRVDRHVAVMVRYRIANRRAYRLDGPKQVAGLPRG